VVDELVVVGQARAGAIIRIYRPDGSLVRPVEAPPGVTTVVNGIDWSPDGRRIVIAGCIGCQDSKYDDTPDLIWDLWIVKADGTGSTRLTTSPLEIELRPAWSPDGGRIAYGVACRSDLQGCPDGSGGTWIIRPDGTERRMEIADGGSVLWSPDGTRLAFERIVGGMPDVYVANVDGSHQAPLTTDPGEDAPMAWSPDGSRLLFAHVAAGELMADRPAEIWAMNADGTHATRLATDSGDAGWQPLP
jgi:Tol biopolymer transport system component